MKEDCIPEDHRSRKIYTRKGDDGKTRLLEGNRISKHHLRIEVNGTIDELNSWIGYVRAIDVDAIVKSPLFQLQAKLVTLCSDIASPFTADSQKGKTPRVPKKWIHDLEDEIDAMASETDMIFTPVLPGGSPIGAALHLARTVCRRAELLLVHLQDKEGDLNPDAIRFVNRLSDYLYMLARWANRQNGVDDSHAVLQS